MNNTINIEKILHKHMLDDAKQVSLEPIKTAFKEALEAALKAAHSQQQLPKEDLEFTLSAYPLDKII